MAYKFQFSRRPPRPRKADAPRPPPSKPPTDLDALEKSVNDAAGRAGGLWLSFITFATLLLITTGSVTHKKLFLEEPIRLPVLNADLPLIGYFFAAPVFFLVFHFYLLLQLQGLSAKMRVYADQLFKQHPDPANRRLLRHRIDGFIFAQILAGARERRGGVIGYLNRVVAFITVVMLPIVTLLQFQVAFLPYHGEGITWWHRLLLITDLALIWFFWSKLMPPRPNLRARRVIGWMGDWYGRLLLSRRDATEHDLALAHDIVTPVVMRSAWLASRLPLALVVVFSVLVAVYPTEWIYGSALRQPFAGVTAALFQQGDVFDPETGETTPAEQRVHWGLSNRMLLSDADLDTGARLKKIRDEEGASAKPDEARKKHSLRLVGRDFSFALMDYVDLRAANFNDVEMRGASLRKANLEYVSLSCDPTRREKKSGNTCAVLWSADLNGANLHGADLKNSSFVSAELRKANLREANLSRGDFSSADLSEARLHGAMFPIARFGGADLSWSSMQGAFGWNAELISANLTNARLQGADLSSSDLMGAVLKGAHLQGANLRNANLNAADLSRASVYRATFPRPVGKLRCEKGVLDGEGLFVHPSFMRNILTSTDISPAGYQKFVERALVGMSNSALRNNSEIRLSVLKPIGRNPSYRVRDAARSSLWRTDRGLRIMAQDRAIEIERLACEEGHQAPHVARGLMKNGRLAALKERMPKLVERMQMGRKDLKSCRGVKGFTEDDWRKLEQIKETARANAKPHTSTPSSAAP